MSKKKIIIASSLGLTIVGGTIGSYFIFRNPKNELKPDIPSKELEKQKETNNEITIIPNLELPLESSIPQVQDFISNKKLEGTLSIYKDEIEFQEDTFTQIGTYLVKIKIEDQEYNSNITVVDKVAPTLILKDIAIEEGKSYELTSFIKNCTDNSKEECKFSYYNDKMGKYKEAGTFTIVIIAQDSSGNETKEEAKLTIKASTPNNTNSNSLTNSTSTKEPTKENINSNNNQVNNTNNSSPEEIKLVNTETSESSDISYKYGVKIIKTTTTTYNVYNDGTKKVAKESIKTTYDNSGYSATTSDLKAEAQTLVNENSAKISEILGFVNTYRSEVGKSPLTLDANLNLAANIRALEMAYSGVYEHTRPNGSSCFTVVSELNINAYALGENIALNYPNAASVSNGWKNSPGHYQNMISENFNKIGIGYATLNGEKYWVQMFSD